MLLSRDYYRGVIDAAIAKARAIPRTQALRRVSRQPLTNRPVFVVSYEPRLPSLTQITTKHLRSMVSQDDYLESVYPEPPLISYRRKKNIRESIIRAKVAPARTQRNIRGMRKCNKCLACSYIKEGKVVKGRNYKGHNFTWKLGRLMTCSSSNVVYMLECDLDNCKRRYIGVTLNQIRERIYQHIGYVRNKVKNRATGEHFTLPGHSDHNMRFTILENVKSRDPLYAREREKLLIRKFNTFHEGINKEP